MQQGFPGQNSCYYLYVAGVDCFWWFLEKVWQRVGPSSFVLFALKKTSSGLSLMFFHCFFLPRLSLGTEVASERRLHGPGA